MQHPGFRREYFDAARQRLARLEERIRDLRAQHCPDPEARRLTPASRPAPTRPFRWRSLLRDREAAGMLLMTVFALVYPFVMWRLQLPDGAPVKRRPVVYYPGHAEQATGMAVSPDGRAVATVGLDGRIILWNTRDLNDSRVIGPLRGTLHCVVFSASGETLWAGGYSRLVRVDVSSGDIARIDFPDAGTIERIVPHAPDVVTYVAASREVVRYDLRRRNVVWSTKIYGGFTGAISASPGGRFLAVNSINERNGQSTAPSKLSVFELNSGDLVLSHILTPPFDSESPLHFVGEETLYQCHCSRVQPWRWVEDGREWVPESAMTSDVSCGLTEAVALDERDRVLYLAGDDGTVHEIDLTFGSQIGEYRIRFETPPRFWGRFESLHFVPDTRRILALCRDGRLTATAASDLPAERGIGLPPLP